MQGIILRGRKLFPNITVVMLDATSAEIPREGSSYDFNSTALSGMSTEIGNQVISTIDYNDADMFLNVLISIYMCV